MIPSVEQFLINLFLEPCRGIIGRERASRLKGQLEALVQEGVDKGLNYAARNRN